MQGLADTEIHQYGGAPGFVPILPVQGALAGQVLANTERLTYGKVPENV